MFHCFHLFILRYLFLLLDQRLLRNHQNRQEHAKAFVEVKVMVLLHLMMEAKIYLCTFLSKLLSTFNIKAIKVDNLSNALPRGRGIVDPCLGIGVPLRVGNPDPI